MTIKTPIFLVTSTLPCLIGLIRRHWTLVQERARFALFDKMVPIRVDGYLIDNPSKLICFWQEWFEDRSAESWQSLVTKPNPVILDIGANMGVMGWFYRKRWPASVIHGFEPLAECVHELDKSGVYDSVYPVALGDREANVPIHIYSRRQRRGWQFTCS